MQISTAKSRRSTSAWDKASYKTRYDVAEPSLCFHLSNIARAFALISWFSWSIAAISASSNKSSRARGLQFLILCPKCSKCMLLTTPCLMFRTPKKTKINILLPPLVLPSFHPTILQVFLNDPCSYVFVVVVNFPLFFFIHYVPLCWFFIIIIPCFSRRKFWLAMRPLQLNSTQMWTKAPEKDNTITSFKKPISFSFKIPLHCCSRARRSGSMWLFNNKKATTLGRTFARRAQSNTIDRESRFCSCSCLICLRI